jgi:hypothetical protein
MATFTKALGLRSQSKSAPARAPATLSTVTTVA